MNRRRISALYNDSIKASTPLLFTSGDETIIPQMVDEKGNSIDNDFISYYLANNDLFDRYVRNNHGLKIYSSYDEDIEALTAFKYEIKSIALADIYEFAGDFAKAMIKLKMQLGADLKVVTNLGATEETNTIGARHSEDTYGEDVTELAHGAQSGSSTAAPRTTTTNEYDKTYEAGNLENITKNETTTAQIVDSSQSNAYTDTTTRDLRTDEHDSNQAVDKKNTKAVENTITTYNDLDYYRNMAQFPEFEAVMKRIINKLIIETGASYEY